MSRQSQRLQPHREVLVTRGLEYRAGPPASWAAVTTPVSATGSRSVRSYGGWTCRSWLSTRPLTFRKVLRVWLPRTAVSANSWTRFI